MAQPSRIRLVSPAIDFIDSRLSDHHPGFADPPTHFDHKLDRYVAKPTGVNMAFMQNEPLTSEPDTMDPANSSGPAVPVQVHSFSDIMQEFKEKYPTEPKGRDGKNCSIRLKTSWEEVLEVLECAGEAYHTNSGIKGKMRRAGRFIGDKAYVMKRVTSAIPDVDYSRPVIGALTVLLEVGTSTQLSQHANTEINHL
jgi:hypothetical protein